MKKRRVRRNVSANDQGMTAADREAIRTYRINRRTTTYYRDLDEITAAPKPKPTDEPK